MPIVTNPKSSTGGIGNLTNWLETNVDILADETGEIRAYDTSAQATAGIWLDEIVGDMRVYLIETSDDTLEGGAGAGEDVGLRTRNGSIVDANSDDSLAANVIGQSIYIDAHGGSIGQSSNDLDIDSRYNIEVGSIDDVSLEASDSIFLTEVHDELYLTLAHTYDHDIRLTVREDGIVAGEEGTADFILKASGMARFAQNNNTLPNRQQDALRNVPHGQVFAESGWVQIRAGDDIDLDSNSEIFAAEGIEIYGDARVFDNGPFLADTDVGFGTNIVLRGKLIAGAVVDPVGQDSLHGTEVGTAERYTGAPVYLTEIFGATDEDVIDFGDEGGAGGTTGQGTTGYIFLGAKTRAYGSQERPIFDGLTQTFNTTGDDGEDLFHVFYLQDTLTRTSPETIDVVAEHTLTLDGQGDTDTYEIYTLGSNGPDTRNYIVNVLDTGDEDDGVDEMTIFGLDSPDSGLDGDGDPFPTDDIFLMRAAAYLPNSEAGITPEDTADRPGYVALLHGTLAPYEDIVAGNEDSQEVQRINYDTGLNGRLIVEGRGGNDAFFSDDTTVIVTLDGGEGDDRFQIGQIFGAQRDEADGGLLPQDVFPDLVATTRGWLSPGISAPLVAQGGTGNDQFRVYSNQAELRLEGDDDNDLFIVRAFALAATTDFDWNGGGDLDQADLDAGVAILKALQKLQAGNDGILGNGDDLTIHASIDALGPLDVFADGQPDAAYKTALKSKIGSSFDVNGDGGINYLDLLITEDPTDDVIVLDEEGVATPQIGLGFSVAQAPDIRAGGGQDEVRYNVNAPVSVDGGSGFDKLVILGTEFADDIVITKDGIFGAGLNVRYSTIEVVEVDGLEGDDEFFVQSTAFGVAYRVIGGLGSDTINVTGDVVEDIITRELEGVSGAVDHLVRSGDPLYDGVVVDGFDYNVSTAQEGLVVLNEVAAGDTSPGRTVVREESVESDQFADFYTIRLSQELTGSQVVYVTVSAARSPQEERDIDPDTGLPYDLNPSFLTDALGDTVWLSTDPMSGAFTNTYSGLATTPDDSLLHKVVINGQDVWVPDRAVVLKFDASNWDQEQEVYVFAPDDARSEGDRVVVIQHSVISNVEIYDAADVRNVEARVLDNDTPGVYVKEVDAVGNLDDRTIVVEGTDVTELTDEVRLSLAKPPAATTKVVVDIVLNDFADKAIQFFNTNSDGRLTLFNNPTYDAVNDRVVVGQMTFTDGDWNTPIVVGVEARDDYVREDLQIAVVEFERNDATTDADYIFPNLRSGLQLLDVEVYDNETSGAVVLESGTGTQLIKDVPSGSGENDTYSIRLTREPDDTVRVAVLTDGLADVVKIGATTISPEDYAVIGGLRATQMFNGNVIFGDDGTKLTLTRGEGSDLGSFIDEGFFGETDAPNEVFSDTLTFGYDGANLALIGTSGDFTIDFAAGETIRVSAPSAGGFDANNDDYEIAAVTATQITLTQTGAWSVVGLTTEAVSLSEFVPVEGQRIWIGGSDGNDGDYQILSISEDGQTIVLTATTATPWAFTGETDEPIALSDLAENTIFEGTVNFGEETDPDLFPGQFLDRGLTGRQEGWLAEGFL